MVSCGLEGHNGSRRPRGVDKIQRGAKEAREGIRQSQPSSISPTTVSQDPDIVVKTHSSSVSASTQAHNSTPVPPSLAPPQGLVPQLSASHLPKLNRKCSSRVFACCSICPRDLGKYLKFCCSKEAKVVFDWKLKEARRSDGCRGLRRSCSW